jgi:hypothetical protein
MRAKQSDVLAGVERLEQAVAAPVIGQERAWAQSVAAALADLEQILLRHTADAASPDGVFAEVDQNRRGLVRRVAQLRQEANDLLAQTAQLQDQAQQVAQSATGGGTASGWAALGSHAAELATAVRRLSEGEVDVVMESVNMDLGAGD